MSETAKADIVTEAPASKPENEQDAATQASVESVAPSTPLASENQAANDASNLTEEQPVDTAAVAADSTVDVVDVVDQEHDEPLVVTAPKQRRIGSKRPKIPAGRPKSERIAELRRHDTDVGSTEVQVGLLTDRILHLTEHLKVHPKDKHTNYGLRKLVAQRKRLLTYLNRTNPAVHKSIKKTLNMR